MDINYTWSVLNLYGYSNKDIYTDVVSNVRLKCLGSTIVNGIEFTAEKIVMSDLNTNLCGKVFVPLQDLTESLTITKCFQSDISQQAVESEVAQILWDKVNIVEFPLPW